MERNHFVEVAADVSRRHFKNPNGGSIIEPKGCLAKRG